jgi:hypothetical protein
VVRRGLPWKNVNAPWAAGQPLREHGARLARAGPKAGVGQWLTCRTARAVLWRRPADPAVLARQACSSYSPFLCLAAPGLSLHTQTQAWCWCLYAFLGRWHHSETDCNAWALAAEVKTSSDRSEDTGVLSSPHEIPLATIYRGAGHVFGFRLVPQSALPFAAEHGGCASRAASFCVTSS